MTTTTRNRIIIGVAFALAAAVIGYQMFFSMTPARHADHDHAIASIDAGGYLRVEAVGGGRRNLVGRPNKVLMLHFFDTLAEDSSEERQAVAFAASVAGDDEVEVLFIAQAPSWDGLEERAAALGIPPGQLYLDANGHTADLFGVRRLPETLVYDPKGLLAHQARGAMNWSTGAMNRLLATVKAGVDEID